MSRSVQPLQQAMVMLQAGDAPAAAAACDGVLHTNPGHGPALHLLAIIEQRMGRLGSAVALLHRAIAAEPDDPQPWMSLAALHKQHGRPEDALAALQTATRLAPRQAAAWANLCNLLIDLHRPAEAEQAGRRATQLDPELAPAFHNLGRALAMLDQPGKAASAYQRALQLQPSNHAAAHHLGRMLQLLGRHDEAIEALGRAMRTAPEVPAYRHTFAGALRDAGQIDPALELLRRSPRDAQALAATLNYDPRTDNATLDAAHRATFPAPPPPAPPPLRPDPDRRLRVAYVGADFRTHACAGFIRPLLEHHDRQRIEPIVLSGVTRPDAVTRQLQACVERWHDTASLDDHALTRLIADEQIDVLIDLAGYSVGHRLPVFARRPAALAMTYLGYPVTTGCAAIDYRLTDERIDPIDRPLPFVETALRLPRGMHAWAPPTPPTPPMTGDLAVNELPALSDAMLTLGCFARAAKLNERLLGLWAQVLLAVPASRLLLIHETHTPAQRDRITKALKAHGVGPHRIAFDTPTDPPIMAYRRVDISLDTFPYAGCTTVCESLWMGVPTIARYGDTPTSRLSGSILTSAGLPGWIADSDAAYVQAMARLASDRAELAACRRSLRERVASSALCDGRTIVRDIEGAIRAAWRIRCGA